MINPYSEKIQLEKLEAAELPYAFDIQKATMASQARQLWQDASDIPAQYCPDNFAQASITMYPKFASQTYFPDQLLQLFGVFCIGTRLVGVYPRAGIGRPGYEELTTISIIVLAKRQTYQSLASTIEKIEPDTLAGLQLRTIESLEAVSSYDRLNIPTDYSSKIFLVGVYVKPGETPEETKNSFVSYATKYGFETNPDFFIQKGGIFYVLLRGERKDLDAIAENPLVSVIQPPPKVQK